MRKEKVPAHHNKKISVSARVLRPLSLNARRQWLSHSHAGVPHLIDADTVDKDTGGFLRPRHAKQCRQASTDSKYAGSWQNFSIVAAASSSSSSRSNNSSNNWRCWGATATALAVEMWQ